MKVRINEPVREWDAISIGWLVELLKKFDQSRLIVLNRDDCCLDILEKEENFNSLSGEKLYSRATQIFFDLVK